RGAAVSVAFQHLLAQPPPRGGLLVWVAHVFGYSRAAQQPVQFVGELQELVAFLARKGLPPAPKLEALGFRQHHRVKQLPAVCRAHRNVSRTSLAMAAASSGGSTTAGGQHPSRSRYAGA